jgi:hypothetical protein
MLAGSRALIMIDVQNFVCGGQNEFSWRRFRETALAVAPESELNGLDLPEMGALCYPEFEVKTQSVGA